MEDSLTCKYDARIPQPSAFAIYSTYIHYGKCRKDLWSLQTLLYTSYILYLLQGLYCIFCSSPVHNMRTSTCALGSPINSHEHFTYSRAVIKAGYVQTELRFSYHNMRKTGTETGILKRQNSFMKKDTSKLVVPNCRSGKSTSRIGIWTAPNLDITSRAQCWLSTGKRGLLHCNYFAHNLGLKYGINHLGIYSYPTFFMNTYPRTVIKADIKPK